jgi:drug/metabolite transporter (DMT)-like permease
MLVISALWGACFLAIRWGLRYAPPLWYGALRGLVAGVFLLGIALIRKRPAPRGWRQWRDVSLLGIANVTIAFGAMFVAAKGLATGTAAVLANAQPLLILVPAFLLYGERVSRRAAFAAVAGFAGMAVIAGPGGGGRGALASILAGTGITAGTLLARRLRGVDILAATGWSFLIGGATLALIAALVEGRPSIEWTTRFTVVVLALGLAGTAWPFLLWFEEALRAPLGRLAAWTFLVPLFSLAFGAVFLGERPAGSALVGLVVVLVSLVFLLRPSASDPEPRIQAVK